MNHDIFSKLVENDDCRKVNKTFEELFPNGAPLLLETFLEQKYNFNWGIAAIEFLNADRLNTYYAIESLTCAKYYKKCADSVKKVSSLKRQAQNIKYKKLDAYCKEHGVSLYEYNKIDEAQEFYLSCKNDLSKILKNVRDTNAPALAAVDLLTALAFGRQYIEQEN